LSEVELFRQAKNQQSKETVLTATVLEVQRLELKIGELQRENEVLLLRLTDAVSQPSKV
jgi:hypothetical protein